MATEPIIDPAVDTSKGGAADPTKVTFDAAQQEKIQQLIDSAVARASSKHTAALTAREAELTAQIEAAKAAAKAKPGAATTDPNLEAQLAEFKTVVEQSKAEAERFKVEASQRQAEVIAARSESQEIRKEVAITSAAAKIPFFNIDLVKSVTKDNIVYDEGLKTFVVKGPNGQIRYDSTLEHPLSLEAFYTEYAANNKYLVRSEMAGGTGSSEATRTGISSNGRYAVADIFGPKSSSAKASQLMKDSPAEYKRLRAIAVQEHLLAA